MPHPSTTTLVAELLGAGQPLSGEQIAERIGVSRAAVHKAVETLRKKGFSVEAAAGTGYRLTGTPDLLVEETVWPRLSEGSLGRAQWVHLMEVPSTNTHAAELARAGAPHGTVVVAEAQTQGRGRRGRSFISPSGTGIYLSVVLRPALSPRHAYRLTMCGALAVLDTVRELGIQAGLKWPNDVLINGKKLSGILTELSADAERIQQAIVGVGVNVNAAPSDFPEELRPICTSVAQEKKAPVDRVQCCARLLAALTTWYERTLSDFPRVVQHARDNSLTLGRQVRVRDGSDVQEGLAVDLDEEGALILRTHAGETRVVAGDVEPV